MRRNQPLMGTYVEIWIMDKEGAQEQQKVFHHEVCNRVYREIIKVQDLMSMHEEDSDISQINRLSDLGQYGILKIHPWTSELLMMAQSICLETDGAFDCGVGQYVHWNKNKNVQYYPGGVRSLDILDDHHIEIKSPIRIDLGGIAKGYAVDRGIKILKNFGIENAAINAGGDLRVIGSEEHAIHLKEKDYSESYIYLGTLKDGAIATSSTRFGRNDQKRGLSYLMNPKTGESIEDDLSYSIVAPTCTVADCLTKALAIEKNIHAPYFKKLKAIPIIVE